MFKVDNVEQQKLKDFTEQAYLDYAMYVVLDRALPHVGDGLKPVQRRIVYAMSELGLSAVSKHKKSARTVGDVLGKFHPHGDSACYEAMVLMAQSFSYRYPLIDGQGNWGSADDPKSFAAMRYTESRLSAYAEILLKEVGQGTVEWLPNFDGTLEEPQILPARLPNVLLNGGTGIAVGMATDIPPHNLQEVVDACIHLLDNPKATLKDIGAIIRGPDFPTAAEIITPKSELHHMYATGQGSVRCRAVYTHEGSEILITALPYMVSGAKVLEQIAQLMQKKKLPLVSDLRDESDHENPTRLVIVLRSNRVDATEVMNHLFATTELERTYRVNLNVIGLDGRPKVKPLLPLLQEWLEYRQEVVKRRLSYRLEKVVQRLHILDGFLTAFLNLDEVIQIIRTSDDPKPKLMKKFKLSEQQVDAILDLKLRHLAKLEEMKIKGEQKDLSEERETLELTLNSDRRLKALIKKELKEDSKKQGDPRRSPIVVREEAKVMDAMVKVPSEPMTVVLSKKGWVRAGKGHEVDPFTLSYKAGDEHHAHVLATSTHPVVFLDSQGRAYALLPHTLPSVRGYGEPLTSRVTPGAGATFQSVLTAEMDQKFLLTSTAGYGFVAPFEELITKNRKGKAVINVPEGGNVLPALKLPAGDLKEYCVALITQDSRLLMFPLSEVPELSKGRGRKLFGITSQQLQSEECALQWALILHQKQSLVLETARREIILKPKDLEYYVGEPGHRGRKLPKESQKLKSIVARD